MKRMIAVAIILAASASAAVASGYDDFSKGMAAAVRGDHDAAIAALTGALAAPDLAPAYKTTIYRVRTRIWLAEKNCQQALADADAAIALIPSDRSVRRLHAAANLCAKDFAGVRRDYEAMKTNASDVYPYKELGMLLWREGVFQEASSSFQTLLEISQNNKDQSDSYALLWYAMTEARLGRLDREKLAAYAATAAREDWPGPLMDLYLGKIKPEQVRPVTWGAKSAGQTCEAHFYIAEWHIAHGNGDAAKPLIADAVAKCPKGFIEYSAAKAEAARLGLPEVADKDDDQ
ncbi:hypothetical protein [Rhizomicrobium electricum]|uniref:Tetratricopeptide repeat protein n=1 Tax=Rhizomicrobium electricum TaxID=480070 RepID=A0ABN1ENB4_9PROT|nr:hypothetical protein [Rhizomicrobium electricum]NIJ46869.1 lipoprotein NlpI [Rhizomicrobium electricum]